MMSDRGPLCLYWSRLWRALFSTSSWSQVVGMATLLPAVIESRKAQASTTLVALVAAVFLGSGQSKSSLMPPAGEAPIAG